MKKIIRKITSSPLTIIAIATVVLALYNSQLFSFVGPTERTEGSNTIYDFTHVPKEFWGAQSIGDDHGTEYYTMKNSTNYPAYVRVGYKEWGCWGTGLDMPANFNRVVVWKHGCSPQNLTGFVFPKGRDKPGVALEQQGAGAKGDWAVVEEGGKFIVKQIK